MRKNSISRTAYFNGRLRRSDLVHVAFAARVVVAVVAAAYMNLVKGAVASFVIELAVAYIASNAHIDLIHMNTSVKDILGISS